MNRIFSQRNTLIIFLCNINSKILSAYSYTSHSNPTHQIKRKSLKIPNNYYNIKSIPTRIFSSKSNEAESQSLQTIQIMEDIETLEPSEHIIKKSRFLSYAFHASSKTQIQTKVQSLKQEHVKSRHICYAYVMGDVNSNNYEERAIDDGEPVGTAGAPILGAIKGENLVDTCCIVVRYYGGIKLGAGGLIRAYGSSARLALRDSPKTIYVPKTTIQLHTIPMKYIGSIYTLLQRYDCSIVNEGEEEYTNEGDIVLLQISSSVENSEEVCRSIKDLTRGDVDIQVG